jgi:hypothetical protein
MGERCRGLYAAIAGLGVERIVQSWPLAGQPRVVPFARLAAMAR